MIWMVAGILLVVCSLASCWIGWTLACSRYREMEARARWSLSHSQSEMEAAMRARIRAYELEREVIGASSEIGKRLAALTTASEKMEQVVAMVFLQNQDPQRRTSPAMAKQFGEETPLFPPGVQRTRLPGDEKIEDGFEDKPLDLKPGIVKGPGEPARAVPS